MIFLENLQESDSETAYSSVKHVILKHHLDMNLISSSRNLLSLEQPPLDSLSSIHRLAQSCYPNPSFQKKGSYNELLWQSAASDIFASKLSGKVTSRLTKLVSSTFLLPVEKIDIVEGGSCLSLFNTDDRILVEGVEVNHNGGIII
jgi:hypothetical protein